MTESRFIEMTTEQGVALMNAIDFLVAQKRELADALIMGTNNRQAGINQLEQADVLQSILDTLENEFEGQYDEG